MIVGYFIKDEDIMVIEVNAIIKSNVWDYEDQWLKKIQPPVKTNLIVQPIWSI